MSDKTEAVAGRTRRWVLLGAVAMAGGAAGGWWLSRRAPPYPGGSLSVDEAHAQAAAGQLALIDIRTPREWKQTGIGEGAHPIDMRRADFTEALLQVSGPDRSVPIALICARGVRSARMSLRLSAAGFSRIIDVPEGMLGSRAGPGWLARDLPVVPYREAGT